MQLEHYTFVAVFVSFDDCLVMRACQTRSNSGVVAIMMMMQ